MFEQLTLNYDYNFKFFDLLPLRKDIKQSLAMFMIKNMTDITMIVI